MAKYVPKTFDQILQRMINRVVARTDLSDLTPSSIFKHVLAAVARELDDAYFQINNKLDLFSIDRASGEDLDERAKDYNPAAITRRLALAATGSLIFSRLTVNPGPDIAIPIGTQVEVPGEVPPIIATTTAAGSILTGNTGSAAISAIVTDVGTQGNVAANVLTKFRGPKPTGVDSVDNPAGFVGGLDQETDDSFRQRLKDFARSLARCTVTALEVAALDVEIVATNQRVVFSRAVEDLVQFGLVRLYIDDGTGASETTDSVTGEIVTQGAEFPGDVAQGGETILQLDNKPVKDSITPSILRDATPLIRDDPGANGYTLNPASGQILLNTALLIGEAVTADYTYFTGLIAAVQLVIDGDPADRTNFPGFRAAGVLALVLTPTAVNLTININITVRDGFNQVTVADDVRTQIAAYINGLGIGNDVIVAEIIERSMAVAGMFDITVNTPTANVVILEDQLPRINDASTDITIN